MKFSPTINEEDLKHEVRRRMASHFRVSIDGLENFIRDAQIDVALGDESAKAILIMVRRFNAASDSLRNDTIPKNYRNNKDYWPETGAK